MAFLVKVGVNNSLNILPLQTYKKYFALFPFSFPNWVQEQETRVVHASDLKMLLKGTWSGGMLVLIPGRLELENGQSGKPWFEDHNIEQSSSARQTANDDDNLFLGL